jgi:glucose-6-phosphate 1-epimerase
LSGTLYFAFNIKWIDKAQAMKDFGDEEYKEMVCVEYGNVAKLDKLMAGKEIEFSQTLVATIQN